MKELRIIVAGSRDFKDYQLLSDKIMEYLTYMDETDIIENTSQVKFISGAHRGAGCLKGCMPSYGCSLPGCRARRTYVHG